MSLILKTAIEVPSEGVKGISTSLKYFNLFQDFVVLKFQNLKNK